MNFIKTYLKHTLAMTLAFLTIFSAYAAISQVQSGDILTASKWNEIVSKISNVNSNPSDFVTKSYVDNIKMESKKTPDACGDLLVNIRTCIGRTCSAWIKPFGEGQTGGCGDGSGM